MHDLLLLEAAYDFAGWRMRERERKREDGER
jgi:hypothetical protein